MESAMAQVTFPAGSYLVTTILIKDAANVSKSLTIHSENARFIAGASSAQNGIFDIVHCVFFNMTGSYCLNVGGNPNYAAGLSIRGGEAFVNIHNVTVANAKIGISVGVYDDDASCAEISFFGANCFQCPIGTTLVARKAAPLLMAATLSRSQTLLFQRPRNMQ